MNRFSRNAPLLLPRMNGRERATEIESEYLPAWKESVVHQTETQQKKIMSLRWLGFQVGKLANKKIHINKNRAKNKKNKQINKAVRNIACALSVFCPDSMLVTSSLLMKRYQTNLQWSTDFELSYVDNHGKAEALSTALTCIHTGKSGYWPDCAMKC